MRDDPRLVFTDLETMGLRNDSPIVEVAMVVCTKDLEIVAKRSAAVTHTKRTWDGASSFAREQHAASGLMAESLDPTKSSLMAQVELDFLSFLEGHGFEAETALIVGNSIGQDRIWLATQMPTLNTFLSHRTVDVSAVRSLIQRWVDAEYGGPQGVIEHRAMADCLWSRSELLHYRKALFDGRADDIYTLLIGTNT